MGHHRIKRTVRMVLRAKVPQARVRLRRDTLEERRCQSRLADAGLAGEQYNLALTAPGALPPAGEKLDFLLAATKGVRADTLCSASNRLSAKLGRSIRQARTGSTIPFSSTEPRSAQSKRLPSS